ncbi:MAG: hypothetical protein JO305_04720 [Alphaproteobacteria bacterium]|nr:hypothetical protein [Alphaproteobacteria bacterium]
MAQKSARIFISSPGDVAEERRRAAIVLARLRREFARFFEVSGVLWEYEPMLASGHFQDIIEPPSQTDIVVLIVWSRLGTPLPERYRGGDGRTPVTGTEWEFEDALAANRARGTPDLLVYRKDGEAVARFTSGEELETAAAQWAALQAFWQRHFVGPEGGFRAAFNSFRDLDEFETKLEQHLRDLLRRRLTERGGPARARNGAVIWHQGSPFRGLETYEIEHSPIFFGREQAEKEVTEALARNAAQGLPFLLILGASGGGKSSLARAGVLANLIAPGVVTGVGLWRRCLFRPGGASGDLYDRLARALIRQAAALPELPQAGIGEEALAAQFRAAPAQAGLPIGVGLARASQTQPAPDAGGPRLVLLIDQLEELFTLASVASEERAGFVAVVGALVRSGQVWVLATMRSDFYHRLEEVPELRDLAAGHRQYHLLAPRPAELGEMVRRPAEAAGIGFDIDPQSGLGLDAEIAEAAARDPAALPLLSFALDELYRRDVAAAGREVLTVETYRRLGGLEGAIARRAEEVCDALPPAAAAALPSVLRELVTLREEAGDPAARPASRRAVATSPERTEAVEALIAARLVVTAGGAAGPTLRLAHEALLRHWPRLADLIGNDREFLRARARLQADRARWEAEERSPDLLLPSGKRLAEAVELLASRRADLDGDMVAFVEQSQAREREAATRALRRTRQVAAAMLVLAACAGLFGWYGYRRSLEAERNFATAIEAAESLNDAVSEELGPSTGVRADASLAVLHRAEGIFARLAAASPGSVEVQSSRARMLISFADLDAEVGETAEQLRRAEEAQRIYERLAALDPANAEWQLGLARSSERVADAQEEKGDIAAALAQAGSTLAGLRGFSADHPGNREVQRALAHAETRMGDRLYDKEDIAGARAAYHAGLDLLDSPAAGDPEDSGLQQDIADSHTRIGDTLRADGDLAGSLAEYQAGWEIRQKLAAQQPGNALWQRQLAVSLEKLGDALSDQGDLAAARAHYDRGLAALDRLAEQDPRNLSRQRDLSVGYNKLGDLLQAQGDAAGAVTEYRTASAILDHLVSLDPSNATFRHDFYVSHSSIGDVLSGQGDSAGALASYRAAVAGRGEAAAGADDPVLLSDLFFGHLQIGKTLRALADRQGAIAEYETAERLAQHLESINGPAGVSAEMRDQAAAVRRELEALRLEVKG